MKVHHWKNGKNSQDQNLEGFFYRAGFWSFEVMGNIMIKSWLIMIPHYIFFGFGSELQVFQNSSSFAEMEVPAPGFHHSIAWICFLGVFFLRIRSHGKSHFFLNHHLGNISFVFSNHLKQTHLRLVVVVSAKVGDWFLQFWGWKIRLERSKKHPKMKAECRPKKGGPFFFWKEMNHLNQRLGSFPQGWKIRDTPWKTNMSPENQWLEDVFPIEIVPFQGILVSFRGCISAHHVLLRELLDSGMKGNCTPPRLFLKLRLSLFYSDLIWSPQDLFKEIVALGGDLMFGGMPLQQKPKTHHPKIRLVVRENWRTI